MTTTPAANLDLATTMSRLVKQLLAWIPVMVGLAHQLLMFVSRTSEVPLDWIPVLLDPPGFIYPFVTLERGWWIALTLLSAVLCLLVRANRLRPHRVIIPFYIYLTFLLVFVKPIWPF